MCGCAGSGAQGEVQNGQMQILPMLLQVVLPGHVGRQDVTPQVSAPDHPLEAQEIWNDDVQKRLPDPEMFGNHGEDRSDSCQQPATMNLHRLQTTETGRTLPGLGLSLHHVLLYPGFLLRNIISAAITRIFSIKIHRYTATRRLATRVVNPGALFTLGS